MQVRWFDRRLLSSFNAGGRSRRSSRRPVSEWFVTTHTSEPAIKFRSPLFSGSRLLSDVQYHSGEEYYGIDSRSLSRFLTEPPPVSKQLSMFLEIRPIRFPLTRFRNVANRILLEFGDADRLFKYEEVGALAKQLCRVSRDEYQATVYTFLMHRYVDMLQKTPNSTLTAHQRALLDRFVNIYYKIDLPSYYVVHTLSTIAQGSLHSYNKRVLEMCEHMLQVEGQIDLEELSPKELADFSRSLTSLKLNYEAWYFQIAEEGLKQGSLSDYSFDDMYAIVRGLGEMNISHPPYFHLVSREFKSRKHQLNVLSTEQLTQLMHIFAKLNFSDHDTIFLLTCEVSDRGISTLSKDQLARWKWSLNKLCS